MKGLNVYNWFENFDKKYWMIFWVKNRIVNEKKYGNQENVIIKLNQMAINLCWTKRKDW